ncbi:ATP-binding protein [Brasilonema sp. UFV-L1]|uniref:hybrid sensor histidine kinase/response regulator n=1 Tax=Brasilonema sp. UFV-L1 TaxID=2234130 RepID=UPI00145EA1C5|nr:ATP-binding protein [Brasilonema sp. UFV-L1]NMG11437.1 histidine kinase [Brasilonema sp. UFV-L1]
MSDVWTLLITDDCMEDREVYREYLLNDPHHSYHILEAASAEVGLALCQKKRCDAILLDFCLPDMSGLEFLDQLNQQRLDSPLPVIMLTGQGDERVAVQAMKRGAQDYLIKQHLQPDVLQLSVRNAIQHSQKQNQFSKKQEQQQLTAAIALRIRQSLNLEQILQTTVTQVQQLLLCDRVTIYQVTPTPDNNQRSKSAKLYLTKLCESGTSRLSHEPIQQFTAFLTDNHQSSPWEVEEASTLTQNHASIIVSHNKKKATERYLLVPILKKEQDESSRRYWGLLVACQDSNVRQWSTDEVEIFNQLAEQLAIAIQQAEQFNQVLLALENEKQLNTIKSQFVTTVSYEYRTLLASILAATSTLLQHNNKLHQAQHLHFLQLIEDKARQMTKLVDDLLVIETFEFGKTTFTPYPFELLQFFCDIIEEQRQIISERHELTFKITGNTKGFWGDQKLLRHILVNLLSNAIKYSPDGGNIEVHLMGNDSHIIFDVKDQGIGIPIEEQKHLFQAFRRGSNVGAIPGIGLGLAIVKACVELHRGEITVESQEKQGTKITVNLPKRAT